MTKKINLTDWNEAIDFLVSQSNSKTHTKEYYINQLKEELINEINYLWDNGKLNINKWEESVWNDELCSDWHEYFDLTNEFGKTSKVDSEDYSLTEYELTKKYGSDWVEENFCGYSITIKDDLSIDQLESLADEMSSKYYAFWSYEISEEISYIIPEFHQYETFQHSKYQEEKSKYENFKFEEDDADEENDN
ncbi:hypothetical protein [Metamycoplasma hyosynoviae]|uniref:hypothetical protein n=1 Tax=Metamycoplasma hyosynoviae TaxID=29559 RepID=UPI002359C2C6|nr:hypothetical protein [Metamycoplasma hyosynoviae]MDC8921006.1 hypothetical protein [Metamycoplasma hyosynoviae]MDD1359515.1 hypothetical protein [Metamycoplasma hyosynoviae]MDD1360868.1 hypothetical protein [Metamycoplasma hyosynoviae]MDD1361937.1 hypothetical protein [Metamycoplasma hyosynoviae]